MAEEVTQITRPSPIIEEAQKNYLTSLKDQVGTALNTDAFAPSVVGKTALDQAIQQQQATQAGLGTLSFDQTGAISGLSGSGVASYQPFLDTAQSTLGDVSPFITAAGQNFQTQAGLTGPTAYQNFESPYQSAVRDATLAQFDEQAQIRQQGMLGAQQGQLAGLTSGLANQQLGLAQSVPALQMGALNLGQGIAQQDFGFRQAQEDATRQGNRMQQFEAVDRLARLGQGITGLTPGGGSVVTSTGIPAATPSPLSQAATAGIGAFSIGKLFGL